MDDDDDDCNEMTRSRFVIRGRERGAGRRGGDSEWE
jgi:hypothetical protein